MIGIVLFFGTHSVSMFALSLRDRMVSTSPLLWKFGYGVISLVGLVLMSLGYIELKANPTVLYIPPAWLYYIPPVLLLPVFILFLAPYFPGWISRSLRHPQLVAVKSWALSHLLVNGTLGDVLLFGSFLLWGGALRVSIRCQREGAVRPVPGAPPSRVNDIILVIVGLLFYGLFVAWAHYAWFGVDPVIVFRG